MSERDKLTMNRSFIGLLVVLFTTAITNALPIKAIIKTAEVIVTWGRKSNML